MPKQPEENLPPALIVPVSKITKQKPPHIKESRPYTPAPNNSSLRIYVRWAILGGIVIVGIVLAVFASMYFNIFEKNTDPTNPTVTIPTLIKTTQQYEVPLGDTGETFLNELNTKVTSAPQGVTQFYPTLSDGASVRPATSNEIFVSLGTHLDAKTIRALDDTLMFGSVTSVSNEAFLVLRSRNFDTLFAGMLAWESYIATDFSPLFGTAPQTNTRFTDAVRNNNATRILYDTTQKEILLYSFVNQNTVVITTSSEALSKIIEQF